MNSSLVLVSCLSCVSWFLSVAPAPAAVTLVGVASVPGTAADKSGLAAPHNRLGGIGSAVAYTGTGNRYVFASDFGPKDAATPYACRVHFADIAVTPRATPAVTVTLVSTRLLTTEDGMWFVGSAPGRLPPDTPRLDPEGVRVGRDGSVWVADETGPSVVRFDRTGRRTGGLPVPAHFRPGRPGVGRQPNRGFEGLAITPDGGKLFALLQSPLLQDGASNAAGGRAGTKCRLLEMNVGTGATREFVYPLASADHGATEVVAAGGDEFLVLERDGLGGRHANAKAVYRASLAGATDVSATASLPAGATAMTKRPFLDLLDPRWGIAGAGCPDKFEGLAIGPDLPDGRRLLVVTTDNDFDPATPTRVYAFAVDRSELPAYRPQRFDAAK